MTVPSSGEPARLRDRGRRAAENAEEAPRREAYFFLNRASKAARASVGLSAAGPGVAIRRPVASRTLSGRKCEQVLAPIFEATRFGIGWRHSKRAPGSKWTQLRQQWEGALHEGQRSPGLTSSL